MAQALLECTVAEASVVGGEADAEHMNWAVYSLVFRGVVDSVPIREGVRVTSE